MKLFKFFKTAPLLLLFVITVNGIAQDAKDSSTDYTPISKKRGFRLGGYIGSYFANQYTAGIYDGRGFDIDGNVNNFDNSFMNQKINMQYGGKGYPGQIDQIGQVLNVDPAGQPWTFGESDMPQNMRYSPAFLVGLNCIYSVDKNNGILFNLNAAKLTITGNFTIMKPPTAGSTQINDRIQTFSITGGEQRLQFQFGYQRILGDNEKMNFFVEGGLMATIAEFSKNDIMINTLKIDLTSYYNSTLYSGAYLFKKPIGTGFGAFAGVGTNITINPKYTIQILYNPTLEKIKIGQNPTLKLQHAIGLRAYYNF